jgi:hypothetical protein
MMVLIYDQISLKRIQNFNPQPKPKMTSKQEKDWIELMIEHLAVIPEHTRLPYARKVI